MRRTPTTSSTGSPGLKANYLSGLENVAQALGTMAPSGTIGLIIPLLIDKSGNVSWLLFLVTLSAVMLIAVNINFFASRHSSAGALSDYVTLGLGPTAGLASGWTYIVGLTLGAASAAPCAAYYAGLALSHWTGAAFSPGQSAVATLVIILLAWGTAHRDMKLSSNLMLVIEFVSIFVTVGIVLLAMFHTGAWVDHAQLHLEGATPSIFAFGFAFSFITLAGFETVTTLGEEAQQPRRTIPRVILCCLVPPGLLYFFVTYSLVALGHGHNIAINQNSAPFDSLAQMLHLPVLGVLSSALIALSFFACTLGSINAASRTLYSLARDGRFFPSLGRAHPRNGTPHRAVGLLCTLAILASLALMLRGVAALDVADYYAEMASFGYIGAYFLVCLAAPFYLRRSRVLTGWHLFASVIAVLILSVVLVLTIFPIPAAPWRYLPYSFFGLVVAGMLLSNFLAARNRRPATGLAEVPLVNKMSS